MEIPFIYNVYLKQYEFRLDTIPFVSYTYSFDTLYTGDTVLTYYIGNNSSINTFSLHNNGAYVTYAQTIDGNQKIRNPEGGSISSDCLFPYSLGEPKNDTIFYKGIGYTYHTYGLHLTFNTVRSFIYYNKNGVEWGTPANLDSLSTVSTDEITLNRLNLKVFPNPTNNLLHFQLEERLEDAEIRIYSTLGQLMARQEVTTNRIQFNVSDWHHGAYFYGIYIEGRLVQQGQVLVN